MFSEVMKRMIMPCNLIYPLRKLSFCAKIIKFCTNGALAQLARAPALQAGGPGFESPLLHHMG